MPTTDFFGSGSCTPPKAFAISLAMSGILKNYKTEMKKIKILETKYDDDAGDWYVALGWEGKRAIVKMDSVLAKITEINSIHF